MVPGLVPPLPAGKGRRARDVLSRAVPCRAVPVPYPPPGAPPRWRGRRRCGASAAPGRGWRLRERWSRRPAACRAPRWRSPCRAGEPGAGRGSGRAAARPWIRVGQGMRCGAARSSRCPLLSPWFEASAAALSPGSAGCQGVCPASLCPAATYPVPFLGSHGMLSPGTAA